MDTANNQDAGSRLFGIVSALLMAGSQGLSKDEIFRVVEVYAKQVKSGASETALEQMFTRDKEILRANGFALKPKDVLGKDHYSIVEREVVFPEDVELTSRQLQLLNLATEVWNQGAMSADVNRAALRLRALGIESASGEALNVTPRIVTHEPAFKALNDAAMNCMTVTFEYRKPGETTVESRRIQPWALRNVGGQWLVQGWDEKRHDVRNFLLKRIVSKVKEYKFDGESVPFEAPSADALAAAKADLQAHIDANVATFFVRKGSEAWFHYIEGTQSPEEWIEFSMNYMDEHLLAEDLRSYGLDVRVTAPESLKSTISAGFAKVVDAHA